MDKSGERIEGPPKAVGGRELRTIFTEWKILFWVSEFPIILPRDIQVWTCVCAGESCGSCKGHGIDDDHDSRIGGHEC